MFEVSNQPPPLEPYNLFASDIVLREAVKREQAPAGRRRADRARRHAGQRRRRSQLGFDANKQPAACCARSTATATASTRSNSIRPGTNLMAHRAASAGLHSSPWA